MGIRQPRNNAPRTTEVRERDGTKVTSYIVHWRSVPGLVSASADLGRPPSTAIISSPVTLSTAPRALHHHPRAWSTSAA
jgi:hypothetical protein